MRRKLLWVLAILVVLVGSPWALWVASGPRMRLPEGSKRLTSFKAKRYDYSFSPNGRQIVLVRSVEPGKVGVFVADLKTGAERPIADNAFRPVWLHDGSVVCFRDRRLGSSASLLMQDLADGREIPLPDLGSIDRVAMDPTHSDLWLTDLDFGRPKGTELGLWRINLPSGTLERVQWVKTAASNFLDFSLDGSRMLVSTAGLGPTVYDRRHRLVHSLSPPNGGFFVSSRLSPDGRSAVQVVGVETTRSSALSTFMRLTERLQSEKLGNSLFRSYGRSFSLRVVVYDLQNGSSEEIAELTDGGEAVWHPDGRHLIAQGDGHLWLIPLPQNLWSKPAPGFTNPK